MCKGATDYSYAVSWMCIVWCPVIADISMSNAETLINAFMTSRLDYCNSSLGGWLLYCPSLSLQFKNSGNLIIPRISKSTAGGRSFFSAQTLNQPRIVRRGRHTLSI